MKKSMVVATALAMGILSLGAVTASASSSCCADNTCTDKQIVQQFEKEAAETVRALKAKDLELRQQYNYDSFDNRKVDELEAEIKHLKDEIKAVADKYGIASCCIS